MLRAGNDIGGTFTDTVFLDEQSGEMHVGKVLTTPGDPSVGAIEGLLDLLEQLDAQPQQVRNIVHGTTLVANTLIERKGARTALLTTRGFRDILEARTEKRYELYDLNAELPEPLVPRDLRIEVAERMDESGQVVLPLDEESAALAVEQVEAEAVQAVAIGFLHSYKNPAHEREMRSIIRRRLPGMHVSLSAEVVPQIREYQRFSTTVANAYVQPLMDRYLSGLHDRLHQMGLAEQLYIMLSSGGITTSDVSREFPIRVVESGPAAGAIAGALYGSLLGLERVVTYDMGGTTAKICFVEAGHPMTTTEFEVARVQRFKKGSGLPIKVPVIDMLEIGAGGGSIARVDRMGLLKVGPDSAGAKPGPACYDLGGRDPTVTDADLLLGYLDAAYFLGGRLPLERERAVDAITRHIASPLRIGLTRAAWGICEVVNENMANAARVHAIEKGKDLRGHTMIAFGGAGPIHAGWIARSLGIRQVVIPFAAGVTSALGFLAAPFSFDFVRTYITRLAELDIASINTMLGEMEREGIQLLSRAGVEEGDVTIVRSCEMRYVGQGHQVVVPVPAGVLDQSSLNEIREAFEREYRVLYFRTNEGYPVECLNWRVVAMGPKPDMALARRSDAVGTGVQVAEKGSRPVYFAEFQDFRECPVYDRYKLPIGAALSGPAVVEERESTAVVGPNAHATVDQFLNLIISLQGH